MKLPTKPTGKTWAEDAKALLDMGAMVIDSATVSGLLAENEEFRNLLGRITTCADCAGSTMLAKVLMQRRRELLAK